MKLSHFLAFSSWVSTLASLWLLLLRYLPIDGITVVIVLFFLFVAVCSSAVASSSKIKK